MKDAGCLGELWTPENWTAALGLCRCIGKLWVVQVRLDEAGEATYRACPLPQAVRQSQSDLANGHSPAWAIVDVGKNQQQAEQSIRCHRQRRRVLASLGEKQEVYR